jgi:SAM-dependent methyltransferase
MLSPTSTTAYDEVPFPSAPLPRTHPSHLGGLVLLHGLTVAQPKRILDIGCGAGRNLAWIAATLPDAMFLGVDVAGSAVEDARRYADKLLVTNVQFEQCSFESIRAEPFDVILATGLYSWVNETLRRSLLNFVDQHLSSEGIALISFHEELRPWRTEELLRNPDRVRIAKETIPELAEYDEGLLFHDALAAVSDPISIDQFQTALPQGLQYLCDARISPEPAFHEAVIIRSGRKAGEPFLDRIWWVTEDSFPTTIQASTPPGEIVEVLSAPRPLVSRATSSRPLAWPPARVLANEGETNVLSYFGAEVELDEDDRQLLASLDGNTVAGGESVDFFARAGLLIA